METPPKSALQATAPPTAPPPIPKATIAELRQRAAHLRREITRIVLDAGIDVSSMPKATELRTAYATLQREISEAQQRTRELGAARQDYQLRENLATAKGKELNRANGHLESFAAELGKQSFQGFTQGQVPLHPALSGRISAQNTVRELRRQYDELAQSGAMPLFARAKAKGQQLLLLGKIKFEEMKFADLEMKAGRQIIGLNQEDSVACGNTSQVICQITLARQKVALLHKDLGEARTSFEAGKAEIRRQFNLPSLENIASFDAEIRRLKQISTEKTTSALAMESTIPTMLLAESESNVHPLLTELLAELRDKEAEVHSKEAELQKAVPSAVTGHTQGQNTSPTNNPQSVDSETKTEDTSNTKEPPKLNEETFSVITEEILNSNDASCRRYTGKNIDIPAAFAEIKDRIQGHIGDKMQQFHAEDTWVIMYHFPPTVTILFKGEANSLLVKARVAHTVEYIEAEVRKAGVAGAVNAAKHTGMVAVGTAAACAAAGILSGGVLIAPMLAFGIPCVVAGGASNSSMARNRLLNALAKAQEALIKSVDEVVLNHIGNQVIAAPPDDIMSKIKKLAELKDVGAITQEEFEKKKAELLARL